VKVLFLAHSFPRYITDPVGSFVLRLAAALRAAGRASGGARQAGAKA